MYYRIIFLFSYVLLTFNIKDPHLLDTAETQLTRDKRKNILFRRFWEACLLYLREVPFSLANGSMKRLTLHSSTDRGSGQRKFERYFCSGGSFKLRKGFGDCVTNLVTSLIQGISERGSGS